MGTGNDQIALNGVMYGTFGGSILTKSNWRQAVRIDMGEGDDIFTSNTTTLSSYAVERVIATMGEGDDTFRVLNKGIQYSLIMTDQFAYDGVDGVGDVALGNITTDTFDITKYKEAGVAGNDTMNVVSIDAGSYVFTGAGKDTITVSGAVRDGAYVNMGSGDDTLTALGIYDASTVDMGAGNDHVVLTGVSTDQGTGLTASNSGTFFGYNGNSVLNLGDGDDTFTYHGIYINEKAVINGGSGIDTINLQSTNPVNTNGGFAVTNLSSSSFTGIEIINLNGNNAVDIRFADLLKDTTNETPLYIRGGAGDKVDLGQTNWNSDGASKQNLTDGNGKWSYKGDKEVDGITYQIYHHSMALDDTNDVYIQTGITII